MLTHKLREQVRGGKGWFFGDSRPSCGGYYVDTTTSHPLPDNWSYHGIS